MGSPVNQLEFDVSCDASVVARRIKGLVATHLVLGAAPVLTVFMTPNTGWEPAFWAFWFIVHAELMLLAFWAGMGATRGAWRLLGILLGCIYLAVWPLLYFVLVPYFAGALTWDWSGFYLMLVVLHAGAVLLSAGVCLMMRRWLIELRRLPNSNDSMGLSGFRYSIRHLLAIALVAAIVLGLIRSIRCRDWLSGEGELAATVALMIVAANVNLQCATRASLYPGRIGVRVSLVFVVATLLAIAQALAFHMDATVVERGRGLWWLFPGYILVMTLPTAIVVASLLVVRSCGYRLIPKRDDGNHLCSEIVS